MESSYSNGNQQDTPDTGPHDKHAPRLTDAAVEVRIVVVQILHEFQFLIVV